MTQNSDRLENPTRREAFRRLGLAVAAAYIVPEVLILSEARASSSVSEPSGSSFVTPPTPPTPPSDVDEVEGDAEAEATDTCKTVESSEGSQDISFSQSDFERAQEAVEAGYAKPLEAIWPEFISNYSGKVIGIEFTGFRWRPRYRFRAISATGRLETVIVSARTGIIESIVGC